MSKYFLHIAKTSGAKFYWRDSSEQNFSGIQVHTNLNLLAAAVGDVPPSGAALVPATNYDTRVSGVGAVSVQPWVTLQGTTPVELPIGPYLKNTLDYPLGGNQTMELSLPVYDSTLGIGDSGGGWFRESEKSDAFHGGLDITPHTQDRAADLFEVCAAADGVVIGIMKAKNKSLVLKHSMGSVEFLTIYQHLDLSSNTFKINDPVKRGQFLAKITDTDPSGADHFRHLHFMAAIKGPHFTHSNGKTIPALWYSIDPFGVYDYYKNRTNMSTYNYLPDVSPNSFSYRIQGANHPVQWAAQPLIKTLPVVKQTAYLAITRLQMRARQDTTHAGLPPAEANQCLVWLDGIDSFFFVPLDSSNSDHTVELKMIDLLRNCFERKQKVKLEYYPVGGQNFISAVWVNA